MDQAYCVVGKTFTTAQVFQAFGPQALESPGSSQGVGHLLFLNVILTTRPFLGQEVGEGTGKSMGQGKLTGVR